MSKLSFQPVIHRLLTAMLSKSSPLNMLRCVRLGDCQTDQPVVLDQQVSIALKACPGTAAADADWSQEFSTNELQTNLSMVSKILQRLVLPHVLPHLFGSPTFSQYQSAYRKVYSTDCPTRCPQWCLHGGWRQAGLSAHQPRPICQVWHRWPLTADWASEVLVQIHRHTSVLAALLPRRPWAVRQDRSASVRHSPASTSVFHSGQYLAHCCSAYTVVKWLTSSHSMASSTTSTLTTLSCICRYELTTPLRGSKFLPHVPLTSNSGTCRTACSSTPTSQRCWLSGRQLCRQYLLWLDYCNAVLYGAPAGSIQ